MSWCPDFPGQIMKLLNSYFAGTFARCMDYTDVLIVKCHINMFYAL